MMVHRVSDALNQLPPNLGVRADSLTHAVREATTVAQRSRNALESTPPGVEFKRLLAAARDFGQLSLQFPEC